MNLQLLKYSLKEGFKSVWTNGVMSMASIAVMVCCMILTGSAVLLSLNLSNALKSVEHQNSMTVFLKKGVTKDQINDVEEKIKNVPNILKCEYYSSEQASEKYREVLGGLYEVLHESGSPFPEAFHISMIDLAFYEKTVKELQSIENVDSVSDRSDTAKRLSDLNTLISTAGIWTVCSLGIVSMFIISNTIKLTIHSRRVEIGIMKSVGATNWFIRAPFIVEGIIIGMISALISSIILDFTYKTFVEVLGRIVSFHGIYSKNIFLSILGYFSSAGLICGIVGGIIPIRRYLKRDGVSFEGQ